MKFTMKEYEESVAYLQGVLGTIKPEVALILGSGLAYLGDFVENPVVVPYGDIPNFKPSTAPGHVGQFVFGTLEGKTVAVMQGRQHYYEGYELEEVTFAVRVLKLLGCDKLFVTNAAGCVNADWQAGELMLITDHIKLALHSPLRGQNLSEFGVRFPDMGNAYHKALGNLAKTAAQNLNLTLREGVYFFSSGPQYETPAEVKAIRILGGDAVGMSTVPEVIVANHCGMEILGISLLSNMAAGILDQALSEEEVLQAGAEAKEKFSALIRQCLADC